MTDKTLEKEAEEIRLLRLRNLIASKETEVAIGNRELQQGDGWLYDHAERIRELDAEIDELLAGATRQTGGDRKLHETTHEEGSVVQKNVSPTPTAGMPSDERLGVIIEKARNGYYALGQRERTVSLEKWIALDVRAECQAEISRLRAIECELTQGVDMLRVEMERKQREVVNFTVDKMATVFDATTLPLEKLKEDIHAAYLSQTGKEKQE